jgi:hypothetical protein
MKIKQTHPKIKAMAFGGCSFTWGQGLYYYSALESLRADPSYGYNHTQHNIVHHSFRQRWRWPSMVADHFNTIAVTHHENGGSNDLIIEYWDKSFSIDESTIIPAFNKLQRATPTQPLKYSDVSHFVFQFTQWMRTRFPVPVNGKIKMLDSYDCGDKNHPEYQQAFLDYIDKLDIEVDKDNNKLGTFHRNIIKNDVANVKKFLQGLEEQGIKTYILCWPFDHLELIKDDEWLSARFIQFEYNGKKFNCIEEMQRDGGPGLYIENDFDFFEEPPEDMHPSMNCHKIIADNVIKFIEENNG